MGKKIVVDNDIAKKPFFGEILDNYTAWTKTPRGKYFTEERKDIYGKESLGTQAMEDLGAISSIAMIVTMGVHGVQQLQNLIQSAKTNRAVYGIGSHLPKIEEALGKLGFKLPKGMSVPDKVRTLGELSFKSRSLGEALNFAAKNPAKFYAGVPVPWNKGDVVSFGGKTFEFLSQSGNLANLTTATGKNIQLTLSKLQQANPVEVMTHALQMAKPIQKGQEELYKKARGEKLARAKAVGEKTTGEKGFYQELGQLKGKLPKAQFEAIRRKVGQKEIDSLFDMIKMSNQLNDWQKITARQGLAKMMGEFGGTVPTEGEQKLLKRVYGEEFVNVLRDKRGMWAKFKEAGYQISNIPRSIMASFDLSAPFRQGAFLIGRQKNFWSAFGKMFPAFKGEAGFNAIQETIKNHPNYLMMDESNLSLTALGEDLSEREEHFLSSWAEKIPGIGAGVRASERAYVGFLNKLRADTFNDLVKRAEDLGLNPQGNLDLTKKIADYVNTATGRGSLGKLNKATVGLNAVFFSPRLMASRIKLLNPVYYTRQHPFVRKEALKDLLTFAATVGTILGLSKLGGQEVGDDPRSSDYAKIKVGNTRIDTLAGFQQYIRMAGQLISGEYVSSTSGKVITLGEGYKPITRRDILQRQLESKLSPVASFANLLLKGQTFQGEKVNVPKEIGTRFVPMVIQDLYDIMQDDPSLLPAVGLAIFGVGVQTYEQKKQGLIGKWKRKQANKKGGLVEEWKRRQKSQRINY